MKYIIRTIKKPVYRISALDLKGDKELKPLTIFYESGYTKNQMLRKVREDMLIPKQVQLVVTDVEYNEAVYRMSVDDFIKNAECISSEANKIHPEEF